MQRSTAGALPKRSAAMTSSLGAAGEKGQVCANRGGADVGGSGLRKPLRSQRIRSAQLPQPTQSPERAIDAGVRASLSGKGCIEIGFGTGAELANARFDVRLDRSVEQFSK